jgi:alanyl-tRNA synthetase
MVFDQTPFYGNSGGQVGDSGRIRYGEESIQIIDTQKENNLTVHIAANLPADPSAVFRAEVDAEKRAAIAGNHTATHLMHEALREVLGTHVEQKGSLVCAENLRFDFSHFQKVTDGELREVERLVNAKIRKNFPLDEERECPIDRARERGAMMLFGEKYGEKVRVVSFGTATELCGGTHVVSTGHIGFFKILSEGAISAGVRRIEAITGVPAEKYVENMEDMLRGIRNFLNNPQVVEGIKKLKDDNTELMRELAEMHKERVDAMLEKLSSELKEEDGMVLCAREIPIDAAYLKDIAFALRQKMPKVVVVAGSAAGGKPTLTIMLGDDIVSQGVNASEVVRAAAKEIDGGGGGQPFFATAGGKNPDGLKRAIDAAVGVIRGKMG